MSQTVSASVLHGSRDLRLETRTLPAPAPDEIQVAVTRTTLCGSDLHYFNHFANGDILVREPLTLGHESAGIVTAVGSAVSPEMFAEGDRVALEVGVPCDTCSLCTIGRYNLCETLRFRSSAKSFPHFQGTLQDKINHPAKWCHKLPEDMTLDQGALLEPLSVALHACKRAQLEPKSRTLVLGAGPIGLLVARCLTADGHDVFITDNDDRRVSFALSNSWVRHGHVVSSRTRGQSPRENIQLSREAAVLMVNMFPNATGADIEGPSRQFDRSFDCTGVESCVQTAIMATAPGGKVVLVGMGHPIQTLLMSSAALREVDIIGTFRYAHMYPIGIEMFKSGQLEGVEKLITHRYDGLESVPEAFDTASQAGEERNEFVLKVLIQNDFA